MCGALDFGFGFDRSRVGWRAVITILGALVLSVSYPAIGTCMFGRCVYSATRPLYRRVRLRGPALTLPVIGTPSAFALLSSYTSRTFESDRSLRAPPAPEVIEPADGDALSFINGSPESRNRTNNSHPTMIENKRTTNHRTNRCIEALPRSISGEYR